MRNAAIAFMLSLVALLANASFCGAEDTNMSVTVDAGRLKGTETNGIVSYRGIPYAAAPVGALRWRPPQSATPWVGERLATAYGNDCLQNKFFADAYPSHQPTSEDCLYLNVWAPAAPANGPVPVMVWIHGGGFTTGSGAIGAFDGAALARKGVVVVTFNYRLGRFGFFAHPALLREHPDEPIGNYGLMDQIAALDWVHRNIARFGGDPGKVTIFGESAGGASVLRMMISPQAVGLFQRAIVESGGGRDRWARLSEPIAGRPSALSIGEAFARHAGMADADATALRAIPANVVLGDLGILDPEKDTYSGPIVDGRIVPGDVDAMFAEHQQAKVPFLIGANDDELGQVPGFVLGPMTNEIAAKLGENRARIEANYGDGRTRDADLFDDLAFVEPSRYFAACQAGAGQTAFLYRFSYVAETKRKAGQGAGHASEIPYVFDTLSAIAPDATESDQAMAQVVSDYWVQFARTGDPNAAGRPTWPRFVQDKELLMNFAESGPMAGDDPAKTRLDAITAVNPTL